MIRSFAFASILATAFILHSQPITVQPSTIPGIAIMGPQSPDFAAAVAQIVGTDQPSNFMAWLPYGLVIKNNSSQALAAVTVVWTEAFDAASPLGLGGSVSTNWFNQPKQQVQPGQSLVALPQSILQTPRDLMGLSQGLGMGNLANYQRAQRFGISVDDVVFASGQFVGANADSQYERYQAEIAAPRSVASTILEMKATSPISDILAWLQTLAARPHSGDFTVQRTTSAARQMLNHYSNRGEAALYSLAQSILQQPVFPLHR